MAVLAQNTSIAGADGQLRASKHGIYNLRFADADRTTRYLHFKTNCPTNNNAMCMVEAVGYSYGTAQPVRCSWAWYPYTDGNLYNIAMHNLAAGMVPNSVYKSTDNFVCFSTTARDLYFLGVVLNCYNTSPSAGAGFDLLITANAATATAGNYF